MTGAKGYFNSLESPLECTNTQQQVALTSLAAAVRLRLYRKERKMRFLGVVIVSILALLLLAACEAATPAGEGLAPGSLGDLNSYRYSLKMEIRGLESLWAEGMEGLGGAEPAAMPETLTLEVTGAFVAPDKAEARMRIGGLADELTMTVIGDQQWMKMGELAMGPTDFEGDLSDMSLAHAMWGGFSEEAGALTCTSEKKETVNGVPSRYCGIDKAAFEQLASLFGSTEGMGEIEELSLDLWLAEDGGWPVRLRAEVAGTDEAGQEVAAKLEMDITDVNEDIDIKPPR